MLFRIYRTHISNRPSLIWALVPILALLAYAPSLAVGFLADDFLFLKYASINGWQVDILPNPGFSQFYRPIGELLTWRIGWAFWGMTPFPYHLASLILHSLVALMLGLWVATITDKRIIGLISGAFFASYPLHLESVAWIAAQWDLLAALFGVSSLLCFSHWWKLTTGVWEGGENEPGLAGKQKRKSKLLLAASISLFGIALFTKESVLSFALMLPVVACTLSSKMQKKQWLQLTLAVLPFVALTGLYVALRFISWGKIGGYEGLRTDYWNIIGISLKQNFRVLLSPINLMEFSDAVETGVLILSVTVLALGIWSLRKKAGSFTYIACAFGWILISLMPVINLGIGADLQGNRFLYLPAMGYCALVGICVGGIITKARRSRAILSVIGGVLIIGTVAITWQQLQPWLVATNQVNDVGKKLHQLSIEQGVSKIDPQTRQIWQVNSMPDNYHGAFTFRSSMDAMQYLQDGPYVEMWLPGTHANMSGLSLDRKPALTIQFTPNPDYWWADYSGYFEMIVERAK